MVINLNINLKKWKVISNLQLYQVFGGVCHPNIKFMATLEKVPTVRLLALRIARQGKRLPLSL